MLESRELRARQTVFETRSFRPKDGQNTGWIRCESSDAASAPAGDQVRFKDSYCLAIIDT